jgi:hypothetical protein
LGGGEAVDHVTDESDPFLYPGERNRPKSLILIAIDDEDVLFYHQARI